MKLSIEMATLTAVVFFGIGYFSPEIIGIANSQSTEGIILPNSSEPTNIEKGQAADAEYNGPYRLDDPNSKLVNDKFLYDLVLEASSDDDYDVTIILNVYGNIDKACMDEIKDTTINTILESEAKRIAAAATDELENIDTSEYNRCDFEIQGLTVFTKLQEN